MILTSKGRIIENQQKAGLQNSTSTWKKSFQSEADLKFNRLNENTE